MIDISIVIPAFNEEKRLPDFLERVISYCEKSDRKHEIIVVDDGSTDNTFKIADSYKSKFPSLYVVKVRKRRGKGYAVKKGFFKAAGNVCVFFDADGSVGPEEIEKNIHYLSKENFDIFIGSRVLTTSGQVLKVRWYRRLAGLVFNFLVRTLLFKEIKDTQCGFKMFKKDVVKPLFARSYIRGFGFDIEILFLAYKMGFKVKEGPVSWRHVGGSKVNLFIDSLVLLLNIVQIRNWHFTPINYSSKYMGPDEYKYHFELENYHWWFIAHRKLVMYLIKNIKKPSPVILDVGSGTGSNLMEIMKLGKAYGMDASEKAVGFCKKRGLTNISQCPAEKILFADKMFDIITCIDVLEHVVNPVQVLAEIKRVLKDDGKIVLTVPAFKTIWSQHDEALCHLRRYNKETLAVDLDEAKLKIEKMGYFFFASFLIVAPVRIIRRFFVRKKGFVSDTTTLPPKFINEFLKKLFNIELKIFNGYGSPFGTTLFAVVSKSD